MSTTLLILAAGQGSRLRPHTDHQPKCMVPFKNRPIIEYTLEASQKIGIDRLAIVTGYQKEKLAPYIKKNQIIEYENPVYDKTNMVYSLYCAKKEFELGNDVIVCYSDIIFSPNVLKAIKEAPHKIATIIDSKWLDLWSVRMDNPLDDAETLKLNSQNEIIDIGKKANHLDEIQGQYIGLTKFSHQVCNDLVAWGEEIKLNGGFENETFENMYATTFLRFIFEAKKNPITGVKIAGDWIEIDSCEDLERYQINEQKIKTRLNEVSF